MQFDIPLHYHILSSQTLQGMTRLSPSTDVFVYPSDDGFTKMRMLGRRRISKHAYRGI